MDVTLAVSAASAVALLAAGASLSVGWLSRRAERRLAETMRTASTIVSSALAAGDSYRALDGMAERLAELFDADACVVALPTGDGRLFCGPSFGYPDPENMTIAENEGITGACYQTAESIIVTNAQDDPRFVHQVPGMQYAVAVPLKYRARTLGAFELESSRRRYTERDLQVLTPLADQISAALENLRLRASAEERAEREAKARKEVQAISSVVMAGVASSSDLDAALQSMIQGISEHLGWESMAVILYSDDGLLYTRAYYGYPLHSTMVAFRPGEGIVGTVAATGAGRLVRDVSDDADYLDIVSDTRAEMCQPLVVNGRCIGVLNAESPREGAFDQGDFRLLGMLARQMSIVIERARIGDLKREALERLKEADRLKDDFVATVSHELRTPLTAIKGYARTLQSRDAILTSEERGDFIQVMVGQCDRLGQIVEMLLLASRLEAGRLESKVSNFALHELLRDAMESANGVERVQVEVDRGVVVSADRFRIHHIVRNLMENACKYSPPASPVLVRADVTDDGVIIEVLDQGPGIPVEMREEVFGRFQRLSGAGRSAVPGTGLGLYIAKRFAEDVGGDLVVEEAEEEPWTGARFRLSFPAGSEAFEEAVEAIHASG